MGSYKYGYLPCLLVVVSLDTRGCPAYSPIRKGSGSTYVSEPFRRRD